MPSNSDLPKIFDKFKFVLKFCTHHIVSLQKIIRSFGAKSYEQIFLHKENAIKVLLPVAIIFVGFYACTSSQKANDKNVNEIFLISDQIRDCYAGKPDYWGLSAEAVIKQDLISKQFMKNGKITLTSGKEIFIGNGKNADVVMPRSTSFDIILPKLTKAQCIAMAEADLTPEKQVKLAAIQIININGEYRFEWGGTHKLPIQQYASKDLCIDGENMIIWSLN